MECAGWFSFVACSSLIARCISLFGLFHVRQELQIHLSAGVLKRCQRVSVDFLTNGRSFFQTLQASNSLIDSLIHEKNPFVKMHLLQLNLPYSVRQNAVGQQLKGASGHT